MIESVDHEYIRLSEHMCNFPVRYNLTNGIFFKSGQI